MNSKTDDSNDEKNYKKGKKVNFKKDPNSDEEDYEDVLSEASEESIKDIQFDGQEHLESLSFDLYNLSCTNNISVYETTKEGSGVEEYHRRVVLNLYKQVVDAGYRQASDPTLDSLRGFLNLSTDKKNTRDYMGELAHLPRMKSIPRVKALTKWQKFALTKGIQDKKKSRLLRDDQTGQYLPRYGPKSLKNTLENRNPIIEYNTASPNILKRKRKVIEKDWNNISTEIPETDPFTKKTKDKKELAKKDKQKKDRNESKDSKKSKKEEKDDVDNKMYMMDKSKHTQPQLQKALKDAQKSTNSAGKYDRSYKEEKDFKKARKDKPLNNMIKEGDRYLKLVDRISIDSEKVKLGKSVARKVGKMEGLFDKKGDTKKLKKKHTKEVEKRTRKMTDKKFKKAKKGYAK